MRPGRLDLLSQQIPSVVFAPSKHHIIMSQTFTPRAPFSTNERHWKEEVGLLPWSTSIVFTKESLVMFLKQLDIDVDMNMGKLKNLPKYATVGTLSDGTTPAEPIKPSSSFVTQPIPEAQVKPATPDFVPTRRVREQPGGGSAQIAALLVGETWDDSPVSRKLTPAPVTPAHSNHTDSPIPPSEIQQAPVVLMPDGSRFIPTRKVREPTGGHSSMASILSGN
ncbi:hypothetical protein O181_063069 [Austropuccinia psidii MF-1]|uniref:Uncharacterized protein n=1 Tax=Austropuccinia psidii MF-1 TaxID=1389203 RepID=A0A9Q3ELP1_9BASI|nr:hypothetical protein [Austropuccinia psidii MF-1]